MEYIIGLAVALPLAWLAIQLGRYLRLRFGLELGRYPALAAGVVTALGIWFVLRVSTDLPKAILDAIGIGPAVGLGLGLQRPEGPKGK